MNMPPGPPGPPPPPYGRPPYGPPPQWPSPHGQWPPAPPPRRPPSNNKRLKAFVISVAVLAVVLIVAFVGFVVKVLSTDHVPSDEERLENARAAQFDSEFYTVCRDGSILNAANYQKPYKIVAFRQQEDDDDDWSQITLDDKAAYADIEAPGAVNVVACLSIRDGSEVRSGTCDYVDNGDEVSIDHYAVEYDLELREARTGKSVAKLGTVNGPANECPSLVFQARKVYGAPDAGALAAKLEQFAAE